MNRNYLSIAEDELIKKGAHYTAKEITNQPILWQAIYQLAQNLQQSILSFLTNVFSNRHLDVILTGAGTSAFIGNSLAGIFKKYIGINARAIPTTDIVTHPHYFLKKDSPTLLISFARSGDSPESYAAIQLANQICSSIFHLIITCNANGRLARAGDKQNSFHIILPPDTNDQGLAMTGSFTSMLLMGILITQLGKLSSLDNDIKLLATYGERIINEYSPKLRKICELPFERAVFLGSGPLLGCAEECHLKLQELTDGYVISKFDSFLGFRHGPKAIINPKTLVVYLFSSDPYIIQYEIDLNNAVNSGEKGMFSIGILEKNHSKIYSDLKIILTDNNTQINIDFLPVVYTLVGQILGFYKSLQQGLKPDTPSESGTITRVVQGVHIYPYTKFIIKRSAYHD